IHTSLPEIIPSEHLSSTKSFFFQAEDGIRAFHVTGVQTCALPIFRPASSRQAGTRRTGGRRPEATSGGDPLTGPCMPHAYPGQQDRKSVVLGNRVVSGSCGLFIDNL